jgi:hypothetical protein
MKAFHKLALALALALPVNVVVGCTSDDGAAPSSTTSSTTPVSPATRIASDLAVVKDAYQRYADMVDTSIDVRVETRILSSRNATETDLATLVHALPQADHFVPYKVAIVRHADGVVTGTLQARFARWGQDGFPARNEFVAPASGPKAPGTAGLVATTPVEEPVCTDCVHLGDPVDVDPDPTPPTPTPIDEPLPIPTTPWADGLARAGAPDPLAGDPSGLFLNTDVPRSAITAVSEVAVRVDLGGDVRDHVAFVAHFADAPPLVLDSVQFGINNFVRHALEGRDRAAPSFLVTESWTPTGNGCQKYRATDADKKVWGVYNCFGLNHLFDVYVEAEISASMVCTPYTKDGHRGCKVASFLGAAKAGGQGGSWCFQNYYVTSDKVEGKDSILAEDGTHIGIDYSLGAISELVNTTTAKVDAKLEGHASNKKVGGNGSVHVEIEHPGGSYGGVELTFDGEIICPDPTN